MPRNRRSLGRAISQSNRVNKLSDQGALLYTWMIPQYDDDGRMDGDPEDVKYNVVPRRSISVVQVIEQLFLMDDLGLINWYVAENKFYIEMDQEAWAEHQTFTNLKRQESKIPSFCDEYQKVSDLYTLSDGVLHRRQWTTPPAPVDHSIGDTPQEKIRKEKCFTSVKQPPVAPSSNHFSDKIGENYLEDLLQTCEQIKLKANGKGFRVYQWVQMKVNNRGHPKAIIDALQGVNDYWENLKKSPWAYADTIFNTRNRNYHEFEITEEHEKLKRAFSVFEKTPEGQRLKVLIGRAFQ